MVRASRHTTREEWRPKVRATAFAMLLVSLPLVANAQQSGEPQRAGVVTEAFTLSIASLDPMTADLRGNPAYALLFDTLFSYTQVEGETDVFELGGALAESHRFIDDTTLELALRPGVRFHDGSEWNAEVAKWNLERARDHENSAVSATVANIVDVEIVDDYTVRLHLDQPQPLLPLQLSSVNPVTVYMLSRQAVESMGDEAFARAPVGSGPMQIVEWIPDERVVLERFDGHWEVGLDGQPLPYLDGYVQRAMPDQSVAGLELRAGSIDLLWTPLVQDLRLFEADRNVETHDVPLTYRGFPSFYFNSNPDYDSPFTHDVLLRRAVQHALDRESMAAALTFGAGSAHYYWGWYPGVPGYDEDLPRYDYDPERARELLAEAGYADGIDLEVLVINRPSDVQPLEVMQAMLADVGIRMSINAVDRLVWLDAARAREFESISHGNTAQPSPLLRQESRTDSGFNQAGYSNPRVDELWRAAESEFDEQRRIEIYREIQTIMQEDAYHVIGYRFPQVAAHAANLRNMSSLFNFRYLWLD